MDDSGQSAPPILPSAGQVPPVLSETSPRGPWGFWASIGWTAVIASAFLAAQLLGVGVFMVITLSTGHKLPPPDDLQYNGLLLSLCTLASSPVAVWLSIIFARIRRGPPVRDYLALKWPGIRSLLVWCILLLAGVAGGDVLTTFLGRSVVAEFMTNAWKTAGFLPLLCFAVVILGPVAEEFIFRGFLFTGLRHSALGPAGAILLTAAIWAAIHLQYGIYEISIIFIAGIILGFARLKTGSIYLCIIMHSLMNLISTAELAVYMSK